MGTVFLRLPDTTAYFYSRSGVIYLCVSFSFAFIFFKLVEKSSLTKTTPFLFTVRSSSLQ